jgi:hypothetical protein
MSAGILAVATHFALKPEEPVSLQQVVERDFPAATPAPRGLAERTQKLYDAKEYALKFYGPKHGPGAECTDREGRLIKECPRSCPEAPEVFGEMTIDGKKYDFNAIGDRVITLTQGKTTYIIYEWGELRNLKRDGPYKYDHDRKKWQKVPQLWPDRKTP